MKTYRCFLLCCLMVIPVAHAMAQADRLQRGIVRMITTSASSPIKPVEGVRVAVGNNMSEETDSKGAFSMKVTKQFQVNGVMPRNKYILALPTKGKTYYQSANELEVVVTTKEQRDADYRRMYAQIKAKYDQQADELIALKRENQRRLAEMKETDSDYEQIKARLEELQVAYAKLVSNDSHLDAQIRRIADDLALTDYQTLDSLNNHIYQLKCNGEWKSISDLLDEVMSGDACHYVTTKAANRNLARQKRKQAEVQEAAADKDFAIAIDFMKQQIESYLMQHRNDSVSKYYEVLTLALPDDAGVMVAAADFEYTYMADVDKAFDYSQRVINMESDKAFMSKAYSIMSRMYCSYMNDPEKGLEYATKALEAARQTSDADDLNTAQLYRNIGLIHSCMGSRKVAVEYFEKALRIFINIMGEGNLYTAMCYMDIYSEKASTMTWGMRNDLFRKTLKVCTDIYGDEHTVTADMWNRWGMLGLNIGDVQTARTGFERALAINSRLYHPGHPAVARGLYNMGRVLAYENKLDSALSYLSQAAEIDKDVYGRAHNSYRQDIGYMEHVNVKLHAIEGQDKDFIRSHMMRATVNKHGRAAKLGLKGQYYILEWGDWTEDDFDQQLLVEYDDMCRYEPKTIVLYKDGKIFAHDFRYLPGLDLEVAKLQPDDKDKILNDYKRWKNQ